MQNPLIFLLLFYIIKTFYGQDIFMLPLQFRSQPHKDSLHILTQEGLSPLLSSCLIRRGITDPEIGLFRYKLLPYHALKGIQQMAIDIAQAILKKEKMVVVADYDCDGATACAIAVSGLKALGADIDFVVPNRMKHGYGLTPSVVDIVAEKNPRWIITVDNGIASLDGIKAANQKGIGVWVTDHHLPGEQLPDAKGIVNPNQPGCSFPSKNLAGCGVMFYVFMAVRDALIAWGDDSLKSVSVGDWLDLVALGTVADVVKLDENNRWLVHQGLLRIRVGRMRPGIKALFDVSNRHYDKATAQDFGFSLGPRLNAAGRLDDMSIGIRCLLSEDINEAKNLAQQLYALNEERKTIENNMKKQAWENVNLEHQKNKFTRVVFGEDFHEGVIGIVAGRIKEQDFAPTVVFAPNKYEHGQWKGSGRSLPGLHLRDALDRIYKAHPTWFVKFGGHSMAAGMTLTAEGKEHFADAFEQVVVDNYNGIKPQQFVVVDDKLDLSQIDLSDVKRLNAYVWGQHFEEPTWFGEFNVIKSEQIGEEKNHLKMIITPLEHPELQFEALHFFQTENLPKENDVISCVYKIQVNLFQNRETINLIIDHR